MNDDTLKGQWTQLKGRVREQWGKLTNDDIDQIQGRTEQLVGKIQERTASHATKRVDRSTAGAHVPDTRRQLDDSYLKQGWLFPCAAARKSIFGQLLPYGRQPPLLTNCR